MDLNPEFWTARPLKFQCSSITPVWDHNFSIPYCRKGFYGQYGPFWFSAKNHRCMVKRYQNANVGEQLCFISSKKCNYFVEVSFQNLPSGSLKTPLCLVAPCRVFISEKLWILECWTCPSSKSMHLLKFCNLSKIYQKNSSPCETESLFMLFSGVKHCRLSIFRLKEYF